MARAYTNLTRSHTDTDETSFTTASVSPTPNALLLFGIDAHDDGDAPETPVSITGTNWANGLTWTLVNSINQANPDDGGTVKHMVYSAVAPGSVTAGTVTVTFSGTHEKYVWHLEEDTESPTDEVLQSKAANGLGDVTATLDVVPSALSGGWAFGALSENGSITFAPGLTNGNDGTGYNNVPQWYTITGRATSSPPTSATLDNSSPFDGCAVIYLEVGQPAADTVIDPLSNQIPGIPVVDPLGQ